MGVYLTFLFGLLYKLQEQIYITRHKTLHNKSLQKHTVEEIAQCSIKNEYNSDIHTPYFCIVFSYCKNFSAECFAHGLQP